MLILVICGFLIPLIIILVSYTFILMKLSKRSRHFMYHNPANQNYELQSRHINIVQCVASANSVNSELSRNGTILDPNDNNQITENLRRTEIRVTRTALLVCGIYCTAWGPYALMAILSQFGFTSLINTYTTAMLGIFTKTAACINPLVYALSSSAFRRHICAYIKLLYPCRESNQLMLRHNSDSNRKNVTPKSNPLITLSDVSH